MQVTLSSWAMRMTSPFSITRLHSIRAVKSTWAVQSTKLSKAPPWVKVSSSTGGVQDTVPSVSSRGRNEADTSFTFRKKCWVMSSPVSALWMNSIAGNRYCSPWAAFIQRVSTGW